MLHLSSNGIFITADFPPLACRSMHHRKEKKETRQIGFKEKISGTIN